MIRDPFYNDIIDGLNRQLDPELFEECVCDILRQVYPTLVPLKGGCDSGRDGIIANIEGEPISLICTTQNDVIGNFTTSLKSHYRDGLRTKKVLSVTSIELTTRRKDNLYKRATELGFTLVQIHDQPDIANRLYESSKWCAELLNISGRPPALSCLPLTNRRPFKDIKLLGREEDLKWLDEMQDDLLITGQPGCGKTFLLWDHAKRNKGLFIRDFDIGGIAQSLRKQQPEVVILDDAHIHIQLISKLLTLRQETGINFRLFANCWPFNKDKVLTAMHIPDVSDKVRELQLLSRDKIVEVIYSCGIGGPDQLIHEIVNQSGGKPGLATTFCFLCKQGGIDDIVLGKTIKREITNIFERMQDDMIPILGIISLGGKGGMDINDVSKITQISKLGLRKILTNLAAGGVLDILQENQFVVMPEILRCFFVKEIFFDQIKCFDLNECLSYVKNQSDALRVMLISMHRDTNIPQNFIRKMLESYGTIEDWRIYAWLGEKEVKWITDNYPEKAKEIAEPGLHVAPDIILPFLFEKAIGDERPLHSTLDHTLRKVQDWIHGAYKEEDKPVLRRKNLLDAITKWHLKGGDIEIIIKSFVEVLGPGFSTIKSKPGSNASFSILQGHLSEHDLKEIQRFWPEIFGILQNLKIDNWGAIKGIIHKWLYPYFANVSISDSVRKLMKSFGKRMLLDILSICGEHQGVLLWIKSESKKSNLRLKVEIDNYFEQIFPTRELSRNWRKEELKKERNIKKLVDEWKHKSPKWIVNKLTEYEGYAKSADLFNYQTNLSYVYWKLSEVTDKHNVWINILLSSEHEHDAQQFYPFIMKMLETRKAKWKELVNKLLSLKKQRFNTIRLILQTENLPIDIVELGLENADEIGDSLIYICMRGEIETNIIKKLLKHNDNKVAGYTAIGVWHSDPKGEVAEEVIKPWREAIIKFDKYDEYHLQEILESNSELAFKWLESNFDKIEENVILMESNATVTGAIKNTTFPQKAKLLDKLENNYRYDDLARYLVGYDMSLYEKLLRKADFGYLHLAVLRRKLFSPELISLMELAINRGYSEIEVARQVMSKSRFWSGRESDMWNRELSSYDLLIEHPNPQIKKIGEMCVEYAREKKNMAENEEYYEDVYGI